MWDGSFRSVVGRWAAVYADATGHGFVDLDELIETGKSKGSVDIDNVSTKEYESNLGKNLH